MKPKVKSATISFELLAVQAEPLLLWLTQLAKKQQQSPGVQLVPGQLPLQANQKFHTSLHIPISHPRTSETCSLPFQ
jgi:hypothetical protein